MKQLNPYQLLALAWVTTCFGGSFLFSLIPGKIINLGPDSFIFEYSLIISLILSIPAFCIFYQINRIASRKIFEAVYYKSFLILVSLIIITGFQYLFLSWLVYSFSPKERTGFTFLYKPVISYLIPFSICIIIFNFRIRESTGVNDTQN